MDDRVAPTAADDGQPLESEAGPEHVRGRDSDPGNGGRPGGGDFDAPRRREAGGWPGGRDLDAPRRRGRVRRLVPVALLLVAAAVAAVVVIVSSGGSSPERTLVQRYLRAWTAGDYPTMYRLLSPASQRALGEPAFAAAYRQAAATSTVQSLSVARVGGFASGQVRAMLVARTRVFGPVRAPVQVPLSGSGSGTRVRFERDLVFPGLQAGERLNRHTVLAPRAALLAGDGTPLAEGPDRRSPMPSVAVQIAGVLAPIPRSQAARYMAAGYPPGTRVGRDGLEKIFQSRLAGTPGGTLLAGRRVLARRAPHAGQTVRTTIDPQVEAALTSAITGRFGGMVALDPRTGALLGAAGIAFSAPQPPGSTMKIVTSTGLLTAGLVSLDQVFPVTTSATIGGYVLHNANGEACGGTLIHSFAVSCNSVFAPLGVKLGAQRFLSVAHAYGFNQPSPIPGEPESTVPPSSVTGNAVELGASAIGQGEVQATALQMTDVAATIAMDGRRPLVSLVQGAPPRFATVTTPAVASEIQKMMIAVVDDPDGTGAPARIPGLLIAGKTGTAELRNTVDPNASSPTNTDSWFVAYAPVGAPRIAVGALFPGQGAGAATAAPAVRSVLAAVLGH